jgi:hypothetical protein
VAASRVPRGSTPWSAIRSAKRKSASSCSSGAVRPARRERPRRVLAAGLAAPHHDGPGLLVDGLDRRRARGERLVGVARPELEVLGGEGQRPAPGLLEVLRVDHLEARDGLGVLVAQLLEGPLAAGEERPVRRLGLAGVVAEQLEGGPPGPLRGIVQGLVVGQAGEQALAHGVRPGLDEPLAVGGLLRGGGRERGERDAVLGLGLRGGGPAARRRGPRVLWQSSSL